MEKKTKFCNDCKKRKPIKKFAMGSARGEPRRNAYCDPCMQKRTVAWVNKNRGKYNRYQNNYKKINKK